MRTKDIYFTIFCDKFNTDCVVNLKKSKNVFFAKREYIIKYLDLVS